MMKQITEEITFGELAGMPGFDRFPRFIMECRDSTWEKLKRIKIGTFSPNVVEGIRYAAQLMNAGHCLDYCFRSEEELMRHPDMRNTRLFHFPGKEGAPFILVCPGGGYQSVCSFSEGYPAAKRLNSVGFHVFILSYRVRQNALGCKAIDDLAAALRWILAQKKELKVSERFAVMGFSAGGHLAAESCTDNFGLKSYGLPYPKAVILCYAAIDLRLDGDIETAHKMRKSLTGGEYGIEEFCVNLHIDENFPPTFAWQCMDDDVVPIDNLYILESKLSKLQIPHITRSYCSGGHGLTKPHEAEADCWIDATIEFLTKYL